jgi:hypothetical protein
LHRSFGPAGGGRAWLIPSIGCVLMTSVFFDFNVLKFIVKHTNEKPV